MENNNSDNYMRFARKLAGLVKDNWINTVAGIGKSMDKTQYTEFGDYRFMVDQELSKMYVGDGWSKRIISIVPDDMTREWVWIKDDDEHKITKKLQSLGAEKIFNTALRWQRLFAGSIIIVGALDGNDLSEPLNINAVKDVGWLKAISRDQIELSTSIFQDDVKKPGFGKVEKYYLRIRTGINTYNYILVHRSRVLEFFGEPVPEDTPGVDIKLRYWGTSVLQHTFKDISNYASITQGITNIILEFIIGKYKFDNLAEMLAQGQEEKILTRMEIINMTKSIINSVFLGRNEDYIRDTVNVTGLPELMDRFMMNVSSVTGIPVTRLFGRSPAGMNATGESDERIYYDTVRNKQRLDMIPKIQELVNIIAASMKLSKKYYEVEAKPLRQKTEKEEAEIENDYADAELKKAQKYQIYVQNEILSPDQISDHEFPDGEIPDDED